MKRIVLLFDLIVIVLFQICIADTVVTVSQTPMPSPAATAVPQEMYASRVTRKDVTGAKWLTDKQSRINNGITDFLVLPSVNGGNVISMTGWSYATYTTDSKGWDGKHNTTYLYVTNEKKQVSYYAVTTAAGATGMTHTTAGGKNMDMADFTCIIDVSGYPDGTYSIGSCHHFTITHNNKTNHFHQGYTFGDAYKFTIMNGTITKIGNIVFESNQSTSVPKFTATPTPKPTATPTPKPTYEYAIRKLKWGDSKECVKQIEGEPVLKGKMDGVKADYIAYEVTVAGLDCYLAYYFCDDGLYAARYLLNETHSNENFYIDDYNTFKNTLTKKYGSPLIDTENWQDNSKKSYYADRKGDALSYGYLKYYTWYTTDETWIEMNMSADNYIITMTVDYRSKTISPGEADYSDDV